VIKFGLLPGIGRAVAGAPATVRERLKMDDLGFPGLFGSSKELGRRQGNRDIETTSVPLGGQVEIVIDELAPGRRPWPNIKRLLMMS